MNSHHASHYSIIELVTCRFVSSCIEIPGSICRDPPMLLWLADLVDGDVAVAVDSAGAIADDFRAINIENIYRPIEELGKRF
jgi:hypothetical protein